ncbi:MAG: tol-pal system protein YbgF [Steroidobacteraceae bacterium]
MTTRACRLCLICCGLLAVAGCATPPEKDPVQIKLNDLDTRLVRIERVVANQSLLELANELEAARSDVRSLHNDFDQVSNNLAASRKQQKDLYADLDRRLKALEGRAAPGGAAALSGMASADRGAASTADASANGAAAGAGPGGGAAAGAAPGGAAAGGGPAAGGAPASGAAAGATAPIGAGASLPVPDGNDRANYQAAFALLKDSQYDQAVNAFQQFLIAFPDSALADNAQYWLGEAYYVNKNFTESLSAFQTLIDKYPQSRKLPDALLKVGYCDYELARWDQAKKVLSEVVAKFSDTPAGHLAQQRLEKLAAEKH